MKNLLEQVNEKFTKKQIIISSAVVGLLLVGGVTTGIVKHNTTVHAQQVAQKNKAEAQKKAKAEKLAEEKEVAQEKEANRLIEVASKNPSDQAIKTAKDAISKLTDKKVKEKDTTLLKAIESRLALIKTAQTAVKDYQAHATDATKQKTAQTAINGIKDKNDAKVKAELQKAFDSANKQAQESAKAEQVKVAQAKASKETTSSSQSQATSNDTGSVTTNQQGTSTGGSQGNNYSANTQTNQGNQGATSTPATPSTPNTNSGGTSQGGSANNNSGTNNTPAPTPQPTARYAGVVYVDGAVKYRQVFNSETEAANWASEMYRNECVSNWTSDISWATQAV